ncbi:hypothetical protein TNCV_2655741 [Trichonephila clavipes]|nr:hypothetical protein TNCV_2655741 [Trichonephila clavipes]
MQDDAPASFRDEACRNRGDKTRHLVHLGMGNKNLDSDCRNSLHFSGYCRNEVKSLCVRVPRPYLCSLSFRCSLMKIHPTENCTVICIFRHCCYFVKSWEMRIPAAIQNKPDAMCTLKKKIGLGTVLQMSSIIICNECIMAHKHSLEALHTIL